MGRCVRRRGRTRDGVLALRAERAIQRSAWLRTCGKAPPPPTRTMHPSWGQHTRALTKNQGESQRQGGPFRSSRVRAWLKDATHVWMSSCFCDAIARKAYDDREHKYGSSSVPYSPGTIQKGQWARKSRTRLSGSCAPRPMQFFRHFPVLVNPPVNARPSLCTS